MISYRHLCYTASRWPEWLRFILTIGIGTAGGCLFFSLSVPLGLMMGAITFVALATMLHVPTVFPDPSRRLLLVVLGAMFGERVTPDTLYGLWLWPGSLTVLLVFSAVAVFIAVVVVQKLGWSRDTALLASLPGALSSLLAMGIERKAAVEKILMSQLTRLLSLIFITPIIVVASGHSEEAMALTRFAWQDIQLGKQELSFILHILVGVGVVKFLSVMGIKGMEVLSGFLLSAFTHGSGLIETQSSSWILFILALFLGSMIGARIQNIGFQALKSALTGTIIIFIVIIVFTVLAVIASAYLFDLEPSLLFVAYAPGGFEAMLILGLSLGVNPTFVLVHHLVRYFVIVAMIPIIFRNRG